MILIYFSIQNIKRCYFLSYKIVRCIKYDNMTVLHRTLMSS